MKNFNLQAPELSNANPASFSRSSRAVRLALFSALALGLFAPAASHANTPRIAGSALVSPSFLLAPVERELGKSPAEHLALAEIYRLHVKSVEAAATFFYSPAFLRLALAEQRGLLDQAVAADPVAFLEQTEFLPVSLRQEYRRRALAGAGKSENSPAGQEFIAAADRG